MHNVYLLSEPRTGGSYLCQLLNLAGINPLIEGETILPIKEEYDKLLPNAKVLAWRYFRSEMTLSGIQSHYPSIKFINLRRADMVGQAVSEYLQYRTNFFHDKGKNKEYVYTRAFGEGYKKLLLLPEKIRLVRAYKHVVDSADRYPNEIKSCKADSLEVWYEDLLNNKKKELIKILKYLDIDESCIDRLLEYKSMRIQRDIYTGVYSIARKIITDSLERH